MKKLYKLFSLILCIAMLLSFVGCGKDYSSVIVYFELNEKPDTLDAQLASSDAELLLVRNIYEGLLRENENGEIVNGVCESYQKDGLSYTFKLRKDASWSTGDKITADDFVFAFKRAVDPKIHAPFAKRLWCIENAEEIYKGNMSIDSLSVKALDDHTLSITLSADDEDFFKTLTTSICMPCNEDFFDDCHGQYGLKSEYIISNGSYSITKWNREDFGIRIYKNSSYNGDFSAQNGAVFFSFEEDSTPTERLSSNKVDIAFIGNKDIEKFGADNFTTVSYENICWFLTIGNEYSENLRRAFCMITDSSVYEGNIQNGFRVADTIFPTCLGDTSNLSKVGLEKYDKTSALSLFSEEIVKTEDKKLPSTTLTYCESQEIKPVITAIVGHWQKSLSAFINISPYKENADLLPQLTDTTLPMSVFYLKASSGYMNEYLEYFGIEYQGQSLADIQTEILKNHNIVPLVFESTNLIYSSALSNVHTTSLGGYIDFSFIIKKD